MEQEPRLPRQRGARSLRRLQSTAQAVMVWTQTMRRRELRNATLPTDQPDSELNVDPREQRNGTYTVDSDIPMPSSGGPNGTFVERRSDRRERAPGGRRASDRFIAMQTMLVISFGVGVLTAMISFTMHLVNPFFNAPTPVVTIPPMLISLSAIVFAAYHQRNTFITIIAVLIIGVMIASPGYLTSILHILKGSQYDPRSFAELVNRRSGDVQSAGTVSGAIERTLTRTGNGQSSKIEGHLTDSVLSQIIMAQGMDLLLHEVAQGPDAAANLFDEYGADPVYRQYMDFLKHEGLIDYPGERFAMATLTERGGSVVHSLERMGSGQVTDVNLALANPPRPADMPAMTLGQHITGEFPEDGTAMWYKLEIESAGDYTIELLSQSGDPVLAIYGPDELVMHEEIDDSDLDMNVRHRAFYSPGAYFFAIYEWFGDPTDFTFEVAEATPDFGT